MIHYNYLYGTPVTEVAPTEFDCMLQTGKDNNFWLGGEDAKIYYQKAVNNYAVAATSSQTGIIKSFAEYKSYLIYIQNTTLGIKDLSAAYDTGYTHNFKTGLAASDYHQIFVSANNVCYFGNGQYVGGLTDPTNAATVTLTSLDLGDNWSIRTLCDFGYLYLAIAANYYTSTYQSQKCKIFLWNRSDSQPNDEIVIPENSIKAMVYDAGYLWIWAGRSCNLYVVPEGSRKATKIWSFTKETPTAVFEVYPNAVKVRGGTVFFGLSNVDLATGAISPSDVYSFPLDPTRFSLNRVIISPETISSYGILFKSIGFYRGADATLGDGLVIGLNDTILSKKRVFMELIGLGNYPYSSIASYESFRFEAPSDKQMLTEAIGLTFDLLPADCLINAYYKKDNDTGWTQFITDFSTANEMEIITYMVATVKSLKFKITIRGSSSTKAERPFIKSLYVTGSLIEKVW